MNADNYAAGAAVRMRAMIESSWVTQMVCLAAELGLADLLASGPKRVDELARRTDSHARSLYRLLRALSTLDICAEVDGAFELRPTGALLRADTEDSLRSWAIVCGRQLWPVWEGLGYSIRTGKSHRELLTGTQGYARFERDPAAAATFNRAMVEITRLVAQAIAREYDFSDMKEVVDVGGGYGELLMAILRMHSGPRGTLFDLPHAIDGAHDRWQASGFADRCTLVAGSFFDSIPKGADAYLLKSVLHNWDDEHCATILSNCHRAMPSHAKLLVVERVMPPRMETSPSHQALARVDLNMLVGPSGRERTEAEFRALLGAAGFRIDAIRSTALDFSIVEATLAQ
jgi:orsellinic acid C2-O-methyltransferase